MDLSNLLRIHRLDCVSVTGIVNVYGTDVGVRAEAVDHNLESKTYHHLPDLTHRVQRVSLLVLLLPDSRALRGIRSRLPDRRECHWQALRLNVSFDEVYSLAGEGRHIQAVVRQAEKHKGWDMLLV